jgi:hypothetical protein
MSIAFCFLCVAKKRGVKGININYDKVPQNSDPRKRFRQIQDDARQAAWQGQARGTGTLSSAQSTLPVRHVMLAMRRGTHETWHFTRAARQSKRSA